MVRRRFRHLTYPPRQQQPRHPPFFHKPMSVRFESGRPDETGRDRWTVGAVACRLVGLLVGRTRLTGRPGPLVDLLRSLESPQDLGCSVANHFIDEPGLGIGPRLEAPPAGRRRVFSRIHAYGAHALALVSHRLPNPLPLRGRQLIGPARLPLLHDFDLDLVEQRVGYSPDEWLGFIAEIMELEAPVVGQSKMDLKFREGPDLTGFGVADLIKLRNRILLVARPDG